MSEEEEIVNKALELLQSENFKYNDVKKLAKTVVDHILKIEGYTSTKNIFADIILLSGESGKEKVCSPSSSNSSNPSEKGLILKTFVSHGGNEDSDNSDGSMNCEDGPSFVDNDAAAAAGATITTAAICSPDQGFSLSENEAEEECDNPDSIAIIDSSTPINGGTAFQGKKVAVIGKAEYRCSSTTLAHRFFKNVSTTDLQLVLDQLEVMTFDGVVAAIGEKSFFEIIERREHNVDYFVNLNKFYLQQKKLSLFSEVKRVICAMKYTYEILPLKEMKKDFRLIIKAIGGQNVHQKLIKLGGRFQGMFKSFGTGSLALLAFISASQFQHFSKAEFVSITDFLESEDKKNWLDLFVAFDSCPVAEIMKKITSDTFRHYNGTSFVTSLETEEPDIAIISASGTTEVTADGLPSHLATNYSNPSASTAIGSKRLREEEESLLIYNK